MRMEDMADILRSAIRELGESRVWVSKAEDRPPLRCRPAFGVERVVWLSGPDHHWQTVTASWEMKEQDWLVQEKPDILSRPKTPNELVDWVIRRRQDALVSLMPKLDAVFDARAGRAADARDWRAIILKGGWMVETIMHTSAVIRVHLDCTLSFDPWIEPDVIAG